MLENNSNQLWWKSVTKYDLVYKFSFWGLSASCCFMKISTELWSLVHLFFSNCLLLSPVACPSSVSVEVSADGVNMLPLSTPVVTSGLTYIKIQLVKAEVASAVCLRLHRPRDASTLGLSQIKLLGLTAFGTTSSATVNNPFLPSEDQVSKTRYVFFLILKRAFCSSYEVIYSSFRA